MPWGKRDGNNWCLANHAASSTKKYHWLGRYTVCLNTFMYIYIMLRHLLILHLSHAIYLLIFLICNIIIYIYHLHWGWGSFKGGYTPLRNPRLRLPLQPGQVMARCGPFEDGVY
jgi:hypothetical protein